MAFSFISDMWNRWNIRSFVILSLSLQVFLTLFAPIRKKTANHLIIFLLWLAYLMADWAVVFGIKLISSIPGNSCACAIEVDKALQAFWASFLLLHLGGPDNNTAFALADNLLWQRHLLTVIFQVSAAIYFCVQIFSSEKSLAIPTMLLFFAGVIKNAERILSLILSSLPRIRDLVVSQHMWRGPLQFVAERALEKLREDIEFPEYGSDEKTNLDESILVKHAFCFFFIFKVFIGDLMFKDEERKMSRKYFQRVSAVDALRMMSIELQFIYEVLHTKMIVINSVFSYIFRFIAFTSVVLSLFLFNRQKKHQLLELDVKITYALFFGGIALDLIALFMLIFSDFHLATIQYSITGSSKLCSFLLNLISITDVLRKPRFSTCKAELNADVPYEFLDTPLIFQRWSESISACNLFSETLKESPKKIYKRDRCWSIITSSNICSSRFRVAEKIISCFSQARGFASRLFIYGSVPHIENTMYVSKNPFIMKLWIFIFEEVKRKSKDAVELKKVEEIFEARGGMFLKSNPKEIDCPNLLAYVTKANYDSSILMWHIATEMWYNRGEQSMSPEAKDKREFSKILSDYMFYLLVNQHNVVSAITGLAQVTSGKMLPELWNRSVPCNDVKELCMALFEEQTAYSRTLAEGVSLAREIEGLHEMKWEVMSGVWVEMLSYAAVHIKGEAHVQVLSKGGELLAFIWLLMTHFGCFYSSYWGKSYEV